MMVEERTIELDQDGKGLASQVGIFCTAGEKSITYYLDPDGLYAMIYSKLETMSRSDIGPQGEMSDELYAAKKAVARLAKVSLKAALLAMGNPLLTLMYGTSQHPRPGKKDELIPWYMNQFTLATIAHLMKNDTILSGTIIKDTDSETLIEVAHVGTRPVGSAGLVQAETDNTTEYGE